MPGSNTLQRVPTTSTSSLRITTNLRCCENWTLFCWREEHLERRKIRSSRSPAEAVTTRIAFQKLRITYTGTPRMRRWR